MSQYDHKKIEKKWQEKWEKDESFRAHDESKKEKLYVLDMFPYPSGAGLHVGHVEGYTATDIYSRYKRMKGYEVLHPMGWDAFGLPAENYAVKTGIPPVKTTADAITTFRKQIKSLGLSYDWSREVGTQTPEYYKWTQWFFLFLYKHGLAEKRVAKVNWDPVDQTVLANEQVLPDGTAERSGAKVIQKDLEQWFFKIADFADALVDDLDQVDWPESTKINQRNWIGRSEGALIDFPLAMPEFEGDVVFASNNDGKFRRMQKLVKAAGLKINLKKPVDVGVENFDVTEDKKTLAENAQKKARALAEKTNLSVIADDTGFFIDGVEIDPVTVKRNALTGVDEKTLTVEEIGAKMSDYYKDIARKNGGKVDAYWKNALCLITPEKFAIHSEGVRPVILTDEVHGVVDPHLPVRGLYIAKASGKYALEQSEEEELKELQPITDALKQLFTPAIKVFTTRPDTIFGATYMVLAPEHPWVVAALTKEGLLSNSDEIAKYVDDAKNKTDLERQEGSKNKTGVEIKGVKAINPANKEEIPLFVADYVLGSYGTGAIMAVPAHDERDLEFAQKFNLPVKQVVAPYIVVTGMDAPRTDENIVEFDAGTAIIEHWDKKLYYIVEFPNGLRGLPGGHVEEGENTRDTALREAKEETGYSDFADVQPIFDHAFSRGYKSRKNREELCHDAVYYVKLKSDARTEIVDDHTKKGMWMSREEIAKDPKMLDHHRFHIEHFLAGKPFTDSGRLVNSGQFNNLSSEDAKKKITESLGGQWVKTYRLRDWLISRQRYWGAPIPVVYDPEGKPHAIPEEHLPWLLPTDVEFKPTGTSPLGQSKELLERTEKIFGKGWKPEVDTMDTFVCSSWYYFRFTDPHNTQEFASKEKMREWLPVDLYMGGAEHTVLHLMYARFFTKVLQKYGYIDFSEPFLKLRHQGTILAPDGQKMSKSKGNVINPDDVSSTFGADTLRLYEMFMGPLEASKPWNTQNIMGVRRFLERVWKMFDDVKDVPLSSETEILLNKTIKKVGEDVESLKMNTAISSLMILLNHLAELEVTPARAYGPLIKMLNIFAPHIAHEIAERAGYPDGAVDTWPTYDESKIMTETATVAVQINGKVRATITIPAEATKEEALALARENAIVAKWLAEGQEQQAVYVPGKIINFVVDKV
jgi:leucyl-tRNA synthetase